jgi:hypothetical protein
MDEVVFDGNNSPVSGEAGENGDDMIVNQME